MSRAWCWVCDECGKHHPLPSGLANLLDGKRERMPVGWMTVEPPEGAVQSSFCSLECLSAAFKPREAGVDLPL